MTLLYIVPGKPIMCLLENLVDCADCGGLDSSNTDVHFKLKDFLEYAPYVEISDIIPYSF